MNPFALIFGLMAVGGMAGALGRGRGRGRKTSEDEANGDDGGDASTGGDDGTGSHGGMDTDGGHGAHDSEPVIPVPTSPAEYDAFVAALRAMGDSGHMMHGTNPAKMAEHMAAMNLVPRSDASHIAVKSGDWFDPATWYKGAIPGDDAQVLIPHGINVAYDEVSDTRLFTVRVDGGLKFDHDANSQMIVDTMVVSTTGKLTIGTEKNPVDPNVDVDIIFANNGEIDVTWDPTLLSRGLISHGEVEIHGAAKDSHAKVIEDPMAGQRWVSFGTVPEGWQIGDTIVIAGTNYDGYKWDNTAKAVIHHEPEDEVRIITKIEDGRVYFDDPLVHDHDSPREDLKTSVANYTRNVSFETENAATAEIYERGHVMFMHSDEVDVRYAEFFELGRTDKSETALNASEFADIAYDDNVKGRYSFHFHRTGTENLNDPAMAVGNAVFGSPGWGFVHHDSNAIFDNNATYDTFGAGYVAESGNETGAWTDNIAIYAQGVSWANPKDATDLRNFDTAKSGDGFWFQGRMVASVDNVAASVNVGFVYFHRGGHADNAMLEFDSSVTGIAEALYHDDTITTNEVPILSFSGNETFAAQSGLHVVKANPDQGHDIHSVLSDFTAWEVLTGAFFEYTSHYILEDFDLVGSDSDGRTGIKFGKNVYDMAINDPRIDGFDTGINLSKDTTNGLLPSENHYVVLNPTITNTSQPFANFDPAFDKILTSADLSGRTPDLELDGPLTYKEGWQDPDGRIVELSGTKHDGLGEIKFPPGTDDYELNRQDVIRILENDGYYSTSAGQKYFLLDIYFSDRLTGDIYYETHPVHIDPNVPLGDPNAAYKNAVYKGELELDGGAADPTSDDAILWDILTQNHGTYEDTMDAHSDHMDEMDMVA